MDFKHMFLYKLTQIFGIGGGVILLIVSLLLFASIGLWAIFPLTIAIALLSLGISAKHMIFKDLFPDGRTWHEGHTTHIRHTTYRHNKWW